MPSPTLSHSHIHIIKLRCFNRVKANPISCFNTLKLVCKYKYGFLARGERTIIFILATSFQSDKLEIPKQPKTGQYVLKNTDTSIRSR